MGHALHLERNAVQTVATVEWEIIAAVVKIAVKGERNAVQAVTAAVTSETTAVEMYAVQMATHAVRTLARIPIAAILLLPTVVATWARAISFARVSQRSRSIHCVNKGCFISTGNL